MDNSIIMRLGADQYGALAQRVMGDQVRFQYLFPTVMDAAGVHCEDASALVGPLPYNNVHDVPIAEHSLPDPLKALTVALYASGTDRRQASTEMIYSNIFMSVMVSQVNTVTDKRSTMNFTEWLMMIGRTSLSSETIRPCPVKLMIEYGAIEGAENEHLVLTNLFAILPAVMTAVYSTEMGYIVFQYFVAAMANAEGFRIFSEMFMSKVMGPVQATILAVLAKSGTMTPRFIEKVKDGCPIGSNKELVPERVVMNSIWTRISNMLRTTDIEVQDLFANLKLVFTMEVNLRCNLMLEQANFSQAGLVTIIAQVYSSYGGCPVWCYLRGKYLGEYNQWVTALNLLDVNPLAAVRLGTQDPQAFHSKKFPNFGYAALTLEQVMNRSSSMKDYRGSQDSPEAAKISQICNAYFMKTLEPIDTDDFIVGGNQYHDIMADIPVNLRG